MNENGTRHGIEFPAKRIAEFCRQRHIRRLALFGSILRDDFSPESDIDLLIEFEPGCTPGFRFFTIAEELGQLLGRDVDLNTPGFLSKYFREDVMRDAEVIYAAA